MRIFTTNRNRQIIKKKMRRSEFFNWCKENYGINVKNTSRSVQWNYYKEWFEDHYGFPLDQTNTIISATKAS